MSVIIPTYNSSSTIRRTLDSVSAQTYRPIEVIVVDDASSDGTADIVADRAEPWVHVVRRESNGGASAARNLGVQTASGTYVAFLDSDDEWLPAKLEKQVPVLDANPDISIVACNASIREHDGSPMAHAEEVADLFKGWMPESGVYTWENLVERSIVHTSCTLARRHDVVEAGAFDSRLTVSEDWDLWLKLASRGEIRLIDEKLTILHRHARSLMHRAQALRYKSRLAMLKMRFADAPRDLDDHTKRAIIASHCEACSGNAFAERRILDAIMMLMHAVVLRRSPVPIFRKITSLRRIVTESL